MTIISAILLAANVSLVMTMLCAGMGGISGERRYLLRRRGLLVRSLLSMAVLQPAFALWLCFAFALPPAAKVALLAMAVSPMPPLLPIDLMKVRGARTFEVNLCFVTAMLAIVLVPASLWTFTRLVVVPARIDLIMVTRLVATNILLPLCVGVGLRRLSAETSARAVTPLTIGAGGVLGLVLIALAIESFPSIRSIIGNGTIPSIALIVVVGLVIGHVCGGPARKHRRVLAMATATRHPALAIAIASAAFPNEKVGGVVIVLVVVVAGIAAIPYLPLSRLTLPRM
jgi:bile acid:Na+ symporter, BASS family